MRYAQRESLARDFCPEPGWLQKFESLFH